MVQRAATAQAVTAGARAAPVSLLQPSEGSLGQGQWYLSEMFLSDIKILFCLSWMKHSVFANLA